jgi:hypothetical protein
VGSLWVHEARHGRETEPVRHGRRLGWHVGLFSTDLLRAAGGYNPAERLSQDTLMLRALDLAHGYHRHKGVPTYHRWKRAGSLTTGRDTNLQSLARQEVRARNRAVLSRCVGLRPDRIRRLRESLVPPAIADDVAEHVARLRAQLGQAVAA